ncbi:hypothetical protein [Bacillus sp. FJAT-52991]|uniref:Intracellular proteinase inhibitor BsuPI domain-containing protein n=1 Tax=Bacillus kandeliae TaxID=3129297 RepID=A0ABZ2N2B3_9BACI
MKKIRMLMLLLFTFMLPIDTKAEFKVPAIEETEQWKIELLEPSNDKGEVGKFEVYSLLVTNKGKKAYNASLEVYRNEAGTNKMFGLAPQMKDDLVETNQFFSFSNFPVKVETEKLEIVLTWEDEPVQLKDGYKSSGRKYKETVIFTP